MADKINNAILYMITKDCQPLSIVENEGFKTVMKTVSPLYSMPSRKTFTRLLDAKYEKLKDTIGANVSEIECYCLTTDIWTDVSNQSYLGMTLHYLAQDQVTMKNQILGVRPLIKNHDAKYLAAELDAILTMFNLNPANLAVMVTDSAPNIKLAAQSLFGESRHLPCFAHILSHLVPDAIKKSPADVKDVINKVKKIVTVTRHSVVASDELKRLQVQDGKTEDKTLKFIQDVETRWTSTFDMLQRFLELEQYAYRVTSTCKNPPDMLLRDEISLLKDLVILQKPIVDSITNISGEQYPTCGAIIPIIQCLKLAVDRASPCTEVGKTFKQNLQNEIERWSSKQEMNFNYALATILDPRFKRVFFQSALEASKAITRIDKLLKSMIAAESRASSLPRLCTEKKSSVLDIQYELAQKNVESFSVDSDSMSLELKKYLQEPVILPPVKPLEYWQTLKISYPNLFKLAMRYATTIGTSVPSERLFSRAGLIKNDQRNRLSGEHLQKLLFLGCASPEHWGIE